MVKDQHQRNATAHHAKSLRDDDDGADSLDGGRKGEEGRRVRHGLEEPGLHVLSPPANRISRGLRNSVTQRKPRLPNTNTPRT